MTRFAVRPVVLAVAIALALGTVALGAPAPMHAAYPGTNGDIAFSSNRGSGNGVHIFRMTPNGNGITQLTFGSVFDYDPVWSPGGTRIAFTRYATLTSPGDIYVMNADGSGLKRLTNSTADEWGPSWSADGHRIFFSGDRLQPSNYDVFVMDRDGANVQAVAASGYFDGYVAGVPFEPISFTFTSSRGGEPRLYTNWYFGGTPQLLSGSHSFSDADLAIDHHPFVTEYTWEGWLLDADQSLLHSPRILAMDTSGTTSEIPNGHFGLGPAYSPDGTKILYATPINDPFPLDDNLIYDIWVATGYVNPASPLTFNRSSFSIDPNWQPIPEFPLVDARFHPMNAEIRWLFDSGITTGCEAELFCPRLNVTRGQMAAFLARAFELPASSTDHFTDDDTSIFEDAINRVADAGITTGCGGGRYCPLGLVERGQMAAFLARAFELPPSSTDHFTDDDTSIFEDAINRVADAGITSGCTAITFCPSNPVTRGQMAAFLHRAIGP